jgi:hypothetical protein
VPGYLSFPKAIRDYEPQVGYRQPPAQSSRRLAGEDVSLLIPKGPGVPFEVIATSRPCPERSETTLNMALAGASSSITWAGNGAGGVRVDDQGAMVSNHCNTSLMAVTSASKAVCLVPRDLLFWAKGAPSPSASGVADHPNPADFLNELSV